MMSRVLPRTEYVKTQCDGLRAINTGKPANQRKSLSAEQKMNANTSFEHRRPYVLCLIEHERNKCGISTLNSCS